MRQSAAVNETDWAKRMRDALRASEATVDGKARARLAEARARAVRASRASGLGSAMRWAVPAAMAAGALAWMLVPRHAVVGEELVDVAGADALELLTDEMEPEFYQNLELYLWLEEGRQDRQSDRS